MDWCGAPWRWSERLAEKFDNGRAGYRVALLSRDMNPLHAHCQHVTRRHFLRDCGVGLGKMALAGLLTDALSPSAGAANLLASKPPHFPAKAKRVIHLFMAGAPSQLDLFDYKPELAKLEGKPLPPSVV